MVRVACIVQDFFANEVDQQVNARGTS